MKENSGVLVELRSLLSRRPELRDAGAGELAEMLGRPIHTVEAALEALRDEDGQIIA